MTDITLFVFLCSLEFEGICFEIIVDIAMKCLPRRLQSSQKLWFLERYNWLIRVICVLFLQYLMTTDSFLFINLIYILPYRITHSNIHYYILICTNNKCFKTCPLSVYLTIMFCIILLILIIFSIVFYWYVSSKEYWYAQMSIAFLKWASPRFHGLAVIKW